MLPGLAGIGAPWWRPNARAVISGIYGGTTRENVARAALEGIAWRVADVVAAIKETSPVETLRVDGGLTNEPLLLQLQADMIGAPVEAAGADATVLGAAALAGVGAGVIGSLTDLPEMLPADRSVEPERDEDWRATEHERWRTSSRRPRLSTRASHAPPEKRTRAKRGSVGRSHPASRWEWAAAQLVRDRLRRRSR